MGNTIEIKRYYCPLCGNYDSIDEDDVYWHIDEEHSLDELIEYAIEREIIEVEPSENNYQMRF